jgi:uncharacterized protein with HEPN domain
MKRTYTDYVQDVIDNCDLAARFVAGVDFDRFQADAEKIYAVLRALTIIGEAARQIPKNLRDRYPDIPWSKAAATRDRVVHGYFGIDVQVIWNTVHEDLPPLKHAAQAMLADLESDA